MKTKLEVPLGPSWISHTQTIGDYKWLVGMGTIPAEIMIIGFFPDEIDVQNNMHFAGEAANDIRAKAVAAGLDLRSAYFTNVVKFKPAGKKPKAVEVKACAPMLEEEIKRCNPRLIVTLGADASKAILGPKFKLGTHRGVFMDHPEIPEIKIMPTYAMSYFEYNPAALVESANDFKEMAAFQKGINLEKDTTHFDVSSDIEQIKQHVDKLVAMAEKDTLFVAVDCEWHGRNWMDAEGYLRTIQLSHSEDYTFVVELVDSGIALCDADAACQHLKRLLEHPNVGVVGHNVIADGEWLLTYGIDIRPRTVFDTMIAEHCLDNGSMFNLTACTEKYTNMGKYDVEVAEWCAENPLLCKDGYGWIPRDILLPYAAKDTTATYRVFAKQKPLLEKAGYFNTRGAEGQYPSLMRSGLDAQLGIYEMQRHGMLVDLERLGEIEQMYQAKLLELQNQMIMIAAQHGLYDFNFRSPMQVSKLLFDCLKITPIRTTSNRPWSEVANMSELERESVAPSTDKSTLDIIQDQHPACGILRDLRKIDHVCKTWVPTNYDPETHNETTKGGGMRAKVWPDGRIHAVYSQLMETGRFSSRQPNVQNFPKRSEGDIERIFGADNKPPDLRTMFVPTPGHIILEADWKQAELFVLAGLSGDQNMMSALSTPGKDLHDLTAITAFGLSVIDDQGNTVPEQILLDMAAQDVMKYGTDEGHEFEAYQKTLRYVNQRGHTMTRGEFKSTIRVSAKNLNFGIPYGRGAQDIAVQVKAETGTAETIDSLRNQIETMMTAWKTETYPAAWAYMEQCADCVESQGYVENPWGRRRHFPRSKDTKKIAAMRREAQNFPIQSTVADTCLIAFRLLKEYREKHKLHFKIINQVHDAIFLEVPEDEIEQAKDACHASLGNIYIPMPHGPMKLGIDIDLMSRWGVKL